MRNVIIAVTLVILCVTSASAVNLYVKEWYPKENHYVFVCETPGENPSRYNWYYGDGHKLLNITNGDTYHIYPEDGRYTVTCQSVDSREIGRLVINVARNIDSPVGGEGHGGQNGSNNGNSSNGGSTNPPDNDRPSNYETPRKSKGRSHGYKLYVGGELYRPVSRYELELREKFGYLNNTTIINDTTQVIASVPQIVFSGLEDTRNFAIPIKCELLVEGKYISLDPKTCR